MLGAVTMIATLSLVPLQWCLDSSLFAGVCVALAFSTAHKVRCNVTFARVWIRSSDWAASGLCSWRILGFCL